MEIRNALNPNSKKIAVKHSKNFWVLVQLNRKKKQIAYYPVKTYSSFIFVGFHKPLQPNLYDWITYST